MVPSNLAVGAMRAVGQRVFPTFLGLRELGQGILETSPPLLQRLFGIPLGSWQPLPAQGAGPQLGLIFVSQGTLGNVWGHCWLSKLLLLASNG